MFEREAVHSSACALSSYNPRISNIIHMLRFATCNNNYIGILPANAMQETGKDEKERKAVVV